ncbi:hypothetical protein BCR32DRAFT_242423 [Anaeromyces robustus]|uniref:Uncharacterized protein n=1 Tax=Anaeromyces robustus TaxID=1754192 RepID=A0A1Y1XFZ3_9FUNG|nr:hypothetical protein BCR32DRAFT_242423 [Anaeromyces robustus]|eukprot:ORX84681.1 hypothetical protein BCR32DRAFT_242423 [Anaeromyces robustus]
MNEVDYYKNYIFDTIDKFYNNSLVFREDPHISEYVIENKFFKEKSNYPHIDYIKNLINKVNNIDENSYNGQNYIKRLLYKNADEGRNVLCKFLFSNFSSLDAKLYLISTREFTVNDTTKESLINRYRTLKNNKKELFDIQYLGVLNSMKKFYYLPIAIIDNNNIFISEPFSLISFKQFSKRCDDSFIGRKYKNNEEDLSYYFNALIDKNKFRKYFHFNIRFYNNTNDHQIINSYIYPQYYYYYYDQYSYESQNLNNHIIIY